jgi:hypothetical protein
LSVVVSDFVNVRRRIEELSLNNPKGIALLPRNFDVATSREELVHESTTPTVRTLLRQSHLEETRLDRSKNAIPYIVEEHLEWVAPTIYIAAHLLGKDHDILSPLLDVLSSYLHDLFRGLGLNKAKITVVVEKTPDREYKKLTYDGPAEQIKVLAPAIRKVLENE